MLTFKQFVTELAKEDVTISPVEVRGMIARFGDKVRQMGHITEDGSMLIPVDCIVEAARSVDAQTLTEAAESLNEDEMVSLLRSGEALVEKVIEAREQKLRETIRDFQNEQDTSQSHEQW